MCACVQHSRLCTLAYTQEGLIEGLHKLAWYGSNSQSISSRNYRTLLLSNSLKWAWHYRETYPSQIKLCVLIVFVFVGLSTTSEGICCCLMYACCASGNVFYDHYYSNELKCVLKVLNHWAWMATLGVYKWLSTQANLRLHDLLHWAHLGIWVLSTEFVSVVHLHDKPREKVWQDLSLYFEFWGDKRCFICQKNNFGWHLARRIRVYIFQIMVRIIVFT